MVGLGNVQNTTDANKPTSSATQYALNWKAPKESPTCTGLVHGITKSMVGLGNVDNTTDANKPISTAMQGALDLKADKATTYTKTDANLKIFNFTASGPVALNTLNELSQALANDQKYATIVVN